VTAARPVRRALAAVLATAMTGCGGDSMIAGGDGPAAPAPAAMPRVVRAKCGACHRPPEPGPGPDVDAVRRRHERLVSLDPEESTRVWSWVAGGR